MKAEFPTEHDQEFVVVQTSRRLSGNPRSADVNYERAGCFQHSLEGVSEWPELLEILIGIDVSVLLLAYQTERRAGNDQIN